MTEMLDNLYAAVRAENVNSISMSRGQVLEIISVIEHLRMMITGLHPGTITDAEKYLRQLPFQSRANYDIHWGKAMSDNIVEDLKIAERAMQCEGHIVHVTLRRAREEIEHLRSLLGAVSPGQSVADIKQHLRTLKQDKADGSRESSAG